MAVGSHRVVQAPRPGMPKPRDCLQSRTLRTRHESAAVYVPILAAANSRHTDFAIGGGYRDIAAEADDEIELQFLGQHPVGLSTAEAAVGDNADLHIGGQHLG